jgi:hypothetical protein
VLQFATTSQRTAVSVRDEAISTYSAGAALDGAINTIRGTAAGSESTGQTTCFSLPQGELDNANRIDVTCTPRPGSGGDPPAALANQPAQAVLARSTSSAEGLTLTTNDTLPVRGRVLVNRQLLVPGSSTLRSLGPNGIVQAGSCSSATGVVTPACVTGAAPADPGWASPSTYPAMAQIPACSAQSRVVELSPGTYLSGAALENAIDCGNRVIWFKPGTYYLDFRDSAAADREVRVPNSAVVVGGTPQGWVPNVTRPNQVPVPTTSNPTNSACDVSQQGVQLIFAGDSWMNVQSGAELQFCAEETGTSRQHIVVRGLSAQSASLPAVAPTLAAATSSTSPSGAGVAWTQQTEGAVVDGGVAFASTPRNTTTRALRVGPFAGTSAPLVPPEATNIAITVTVTGGMFGPGDLLVAPHDGSSSLPRSLVRACPPGGCTDTGLRTDSVTIADPGLTAAMANSLYIDVFQSSRDVNSPNGGTTIGAVDGITVSIEFSAPMRPTSGSGVASPYVSGQATTTPILRVSGSHSGTVFALHGTVYAPLAAVDLGLTGMPYTVVDRGLVVRHLHSSMTPANVNSGPPLVSVPDLGQGPRQVVLVARDLGGVALGRAYVTFSDGSGQNGPIPRVTEWSVG